MLSIYLMIAVIKSDKHAFNPAVLPLFYYFIFTLSVAKIQLDATSILYFCMYKVIVKYDITLIRSDK